MLISGTVLLTHLPNLLQALLISTTVRSCLCLTSQDFRIVAIGSQPRKVHGNFGGIIFPSASSKVLQTILTVVCSKTCALVDDNDVFDSFYLKSH